MAKTKVTPRKAPKEIKRLSDLKTQRNNLNKHKPHGLKALGDSVQKDGLIGGITVAADGEAFDGSARLETIAETMPGVKIRVVDTEGDTLVVNRRVDIPNTNDPRAKRLGYAANVIGVMDWNPDAELLAQLAAEDEIVAALAKQENESLKALRESDGGGNADAEPQIDKAEELNEKWGVKRGDLWIVGEHRLLCGDCTANEDVERLMNGEKARLVVSSPPYSDQREYTIGKFDWLKLAKGFTQPMFGVCDRPCDVLVNLGLSHQGGMVNRYWEPWLDFCAELGNPVYGWYVWDKGKALPGEWNGRLAPAFEFIFHFSIGRVSANKVVESKTARKNWSKTFRQKDGSLREATSPDSIGQPYRIPDSIIRASPASTGGRVEALHPAVYSTEFCQRLVETWGDSDCIVYDPFLGSGTTLVACQNLSRVGRGLEIEPKYCAVILERMITAFPHLDIHRA